jgi:hypothetical protein
VEIHRWRTVRKLALGGREDLHALTLDARDLADLRADLGDIRLVDQEGRQVPYILESGAAVARVPLTVEPGSRPMREGRSVSRHRLILRGMKPGRTPALPLAALELDVQEPFFDRPARLLAEAPGGRGERALFAGQLVRPVAWQAQGRLPPPLVVPLDESRRSGLVLEVDEGDNAPLTLTAAHAVVRVPRLTFEAGPGAYLLLLGNRDATTPRYDLASLRREALAYSALAATASPAEANPAFRRLAGDYFGNAPPTLLLWGTLLAAVGTLLMLTARVIRQPPGPGKP